MATDELDRLLHQAVDRQMVADVPLGAFLSGGIDSSAIVSVMQARSATPVETFALGFHEAGRDEAGHASRLSMGHRGLLEPPPPQQPMRRRRHTDAC